VKKQTQSFAPLHDQWGGESIVGGVLPRINTVADVWGESSIMTGVHERWCSSTLHIGWGAIAAGLVKDWIARELSLGYIVDVAHTGQKLQSGANRVFEVSLVRKGARQACLVTVFEEEGQLTRWRAEQVAPCPSANPWALFDLPQCRCLFVCQCRLLTFLRAGLPASSASGAGVTCSLQTRPEPRTMEGYNTHDPAVLPHRVESEHVFCTQIITYLGRKHHKVVAESMIFKQFH
jgi:hypothetical protein